MKLIQLCANAQSKEAFVVFYEQFIKLCNENGTRPSTVAEEIGLNKSSATAWEKGATPVSCSRNKIPVSTTDTGIFLYSCGFAATLKRTIFQNLSENVRFHK